MADVLEYKCPCCGAGLRFDDGVQKLTCAYCDNEFTLEAVQALHEAQTPQSEERFDWDETQRNTWTDEELEAVHSFTCPSCGGVLLTEATTAATFCPYCENPTVLPGRLSGGFKPDGLIPFKTSKEDAKAAFLKLCRGKPLIPKEFTRQHRLEKITGLYVPFWLYDCAGNIQASYNATRMHHWSDSKYNYVRTEHFLLKRTANAAFSAIPMDGSSKMGDEFMESIEPFDYSQMVSFEMPYLSGYLADKYDVEAEAGQPRIRERVTNSMEDLLQPSLAGFSTVLPIGKQLDVSHSQGKYVLLPVWMLTTRYKDKSYLFAMNGQTGKMTGSFPICPKRSAAWFAGIFAASSILVWLLQLLF